MPFRFKNPNLVESEVQRILVEQVDRAMDELHDESLTCHERVHQCRKRCKKLRGVLRLVRPTIGKAYSKENAHLRDAARLLSPLRDARVVIKTHDALLNHFGEQIDRRKFAPVRRHLTQKQKKEAIPSEEELNDMLEDFRGRLRSFRKRVRDLELKDEDGSVIRSGIERTYARGREALDAVMDKPSVEQFHELRKRAKYLRYQCRLLREIWKPTMRSLRDEFKELSDLLGDDHDLAVLSQEVLADADPFTDQEDRQAYMGLVERRSVELRNQAFDLGQRLFVEKPKRFGERIEAYWNQWGQDLSGRVELLLPADKMAE